MQTCKPEGTRSDRSQGNIEKRADGVTREITVSAGRLIDLAEEFVFRAAPIYCYLRLNSLFIANFLGGEGVQRIDVRLDGCVKDAG